MSAEEKREENPEEPPLQPQNFSLAIHAWMQQAQATHGIGHDNFGEYHGYCTRRLDRLRHHKEVKIDLVHNAKYSTTTASKGRPRHAYAPRDDTDAMEIVPHEEFLWVLLVQTERAWANGMELKNLGKKQHCIRRLAKALSYAQKLETLAVKNCTPTTVKECQAYTAWIQASWALEKGRFKVCLER
jgi:hypothetical protein